MAIEVGSLLIGMQADVARLSSDMGKAKRTVDDAMGGIRRSAELATRALELVGVGVSAAAFSNLIKNSIDAADRLNDLSKITGLLPSQLAGISLAAEQSGSNLEGAASAISKLSENIGKDAEKYARLGVTARDPIEAFKQLADIFNALDDPQQRAALGSEALGKSWKEVAPLLAEGGAKIGEMVDQGERLAGNVDTLAPLADQFGDSLAILKANAGGVANELAGRLLPKLIDTIDALNNLSKSGNDFLPVGAAIETVFETLVVLGANTGYVFKQIGNEIGGIAAQLAALARGDFSGFAAISRMMKEDAVAARKEIDAFSERILQRNRALAQPQQGANTSKADTRGVADFIRTPKAAGGGNKKNQDTRSPEEVVQDEIDQARLKNRAKWLADQEREYASAVQEANRIIFDIDPIAKANAEWQHLLELQQAVGKEMLSDEAIGKAYAKQFDEVAKSGEDGFKRLEDAVRGWGNQFTDTMTQMVRTGKADFGSLADSIINDLVRIQIQKRITDKILPAATAGIDKLFGAFGFADGGVMTGAGPLPLNKYASGGIANRPQLAMFGEGRMPEAFVPLPDGRRIPVAMQGGAQGVTVNSNLTINAPGADAGTVARIRELMPSFIAENQRVVVGAVNQALMSRGQRAIA